MRAAFVGIAALVLVCAMSARAGDYEGDVRGIGERLDRLRARIDALKDGDFKESCRGEHSGLDSRKWDLERTVVPRLRDLERKLERAAAPLRDLEDKRDAAQRSFDRVSADVEAASGPLVDALARQQRDCEAFNRWPAPTPETAGAYYTEKKRIDDWLADLMRRRETLIAPLMPAEKRLSDAKAALEDAIVKRDAAEREKNEKLSEYESLLDALRSGTQALEERLEPSTPPPGDNTPTVPKKLVDATTPLPERIPEIPLPKRLRPGALVVGSDGKAHPVPEGQPAPALDSALETFVSSPAGSVALSRPDPVPLGEIVRGGLAARPGAVGDGLALDPVEPVRAGLLPRVTAEEYRSARRELARLEQTEARLQLEFARLRQRDRKPLEYEREFERLRAEAIRNGLQDVLSLVNGGLEMGKKGEHVREGLEGLMILLDVRDAATHDDPESQKSAVSAVGETHSLVRDRIARSAHLSSRELAWLKSVDSVFVLGKYAIDATDSSRDAAERRLDAAKHVLEVGGIFCPPVAVGLATYRVSERIGQAYLAQAALDSLSRAVDRGRDAEQHLADALRSVRRRMERARTVIHRYDPVTPNGHSLSP